MNLAPSPVLPSPPHPRLLLNELSLSLFCGELRPTGLLNREQQMKRTRRRLSAEDLAAAGGFKASVQGLPCIRCGRVEPVMDAHHGIDAQYLRKNHPHAVYDIRNACSVCPWFIRPACHGDHTSRMRPLPRASLPESVEEFADELGLTWMLERYYETEAAA